MVRIALRRSRRQRRQITQALIWMAIGGTVLIVALPGIQENLNSTSLVRSKAIAINSAKELETIAEEAWQKDSEIADERLKTYCTDFIFDPNDPQRAAAISEGMRVIDPVTKKSPGNGSIYCDVTGRTAISVGGILTDVKVSRNPDRGRLIKAALEYQGLRIEVGNPDIRPANAQAQEVDR